MASGRQIHEPFLDYYDSIYRSFIFALCQLHVLFAKRKEDNGNSRKRTEEWSQKNDQSPKCKEKRQPFIKKKNYHNYSKKYILTFLIFSWNRNERFPHGFSLRQVQVPDLTLRSVLIHGQETLRVDWLGVAGVKRVLFGGGWWVQKVCFGWLVVSGSHFFGKRF